MKKPSLLLSLCIYVIGTLAVLFTAFFPLVRSTAQAPGNFFQRLQTDNVTTTGKVLSVGPSTVGTAPSVVLYTYDVPGFPRHGNPGSFQREQIVTPGEMSQFHVGMPVKVEYSRAMGGVSRIKGYGTGSIYINEEMQTFKDMELFIPFFFIGLFFRAFFKRRRVYA